MSKQYEEWTHKLNNKLIEAHSLTSEDAQRAFVDTMFTSLHKAKESQELSQQEYVRLINRLASYKQGAYNDYLDMLAGAAFMGVLDLATSGGLSALSPEQSRRRRDIVTGMTGLDPVKPEE